MTRLFLRFYVGVAFILFVASLIANYLYTKQNLDRNIAVIEEALGGGALLARDEIIRGGEEEYLQTMERVESRFKYPVRVIDRSERPMPAELVARLDQGEAVFFGA